MLTTRRLDKVCSISNSSMLHRRLFGIHASSEAARLPGAGRFFQGGLSPADIFSSKGMLYSGQRFQPVCFPERIMHSARHLRSLSTIRNGSNSHENTKGTGSKALFKSTPVDPSILGHIESLGVGISKRRKRSRSRMKRRSSYKWQDGRSTSAHASAEEDFFAQQSIRRRNQHTKHSDKSRQSLQIPPPPFGSTYKDTRQSKCIQATSTFLICLCGMQHLFTFKRTALPSFLLYR